MCKCVHARMSDRENQDGRLLAGMIYPSSGGRGKEGQGVRKKRRAMGRLDIAILGTGKSDEGPGGIVATLMPLVLVRQRPQHAKCEIPMVTVRY